MNELTFDKTNQTLAGWDGLVNSMKTSDDPMP